MKKNFYLIFLAVFIVALFLKRFSIPLADQTLVLGCVSLAIGYIVRGLKNLFNENYSIPLRILTITSGFLLSFTFIGILFNHQWWPFPYYPIAFWIVWPLFTLGVLIQLTVYLAKYYKDENESGRKGVKKNIIFPLIIILPISVITFFASNETFCKIFKAYIIEEFEERSKQKAKE